MTTVFVTHDQEEALEVADEIVVINSGRIEQVGSPDSLYDAPANDFVMSFLGPVTRLNGHLIRPHDVTVLPEAPQDDLTDATPGVVTRLTRVGYEIRLSVTCQSHVVEVTLTRAEARGLHLEQGVAVRLRPVPGAVTLPAPGASLQARLPVGAK